MKNGRLIFHSNATHSHIFDVSYSALKRDRNNSVTSNGFNFLF